MTQYSMTPIDNGTRLRSDHNTSSTVIASYNRDQLVLGDELWVAPADGTNVKKGDKWLSVISVDGVNVPAPGWMAYIHMGAPICDNFTEIEDPDPTPPPMFPESFTLTDPSGAQAEYVFVRIIEK
jgi:hypothetical protein